MKLKANNPSLFLSLALLAVATAVGVRPTMADGTSARDIAALAKAKLVYVATVRKSGNQSKAAPVWFTTTADHRILIETPPTTWKARRIRRGSHAIVWIGSATGPALVARAEITAKRSLIDQIVTDYPRRYLRARVGIFRPTREMFDKGERVAILLTPVRDLPEGFVSLPGTKAPTLESGAMPIHAR